MKFIVHTLPMKGISMLLGNEVVGGKVVIPVHAKPKPVIWTKVGKVEGQN